MTKLNHIGTLLDASFVLIVKVDSCEHGEGGGQPNVDILIFYKKCLTIILINELMLTGILISLNRVILMSQSFSNKCRLGPESRLLICLFHLDEPPLFAIETF